MLRPFIFCILLFANAEIQGQETNHPFVYRGKDKNVLVERSRIIGAGLSFSTFNFNEIPIPFGLGVFMQYDYFLLPSGWINITLGTSPEVFFPIVNLRIPGTVGLMLGEMANTGFPKERLGLGIRGGYEYIILTNGIVDEGFVWRTDLMTKGLILSYHHSTSTYFTHRLMCGLRMDF